MLFEPIAIIYSCCKKSSQPNKIFIHDKSMLCFATITKITKNEKGPSI